MSNEAIDWALKQPVNGNAPRKLILILLANRADGAWLCWPSRRLLAEESGLGLRQVVRHLAALEEDGLIRRVPWERADGGQGANVFVLGPTAADAPVSCTTRGGGRVRHPLNPQEKPPKKSSFAAREESRSRPSPADAGEPDGGTALRPDQEDLWRAIRWMYDNEPEVYERSLDVLKRRAPRLWRQAVEKATDQFREHEPEKLTNSVAVEILAYQWAINLRGPNWPAWLVGPLLEVARKIGTHTGTG